MDRYLAERAALLQSAAPGIDAARRLSGLTDAAVTRLADAAEPPSGRWCLLAVGGYGTGALLPSSDVDLLVLSDTPAEKLRPFVERLLYPLWDASLKVGHQVRSPRDHLRAARGDLSILTATLTARALAGDTAWGLETVTRCSHAAARARVRVCREIAARPRSGSPYLLEPDLKEGAGGRRDYDELLWRAAIVSGRPASDLAPLVDSGHLAADERDLLEYAAEFVAAARWELGLLGEGPLLTLDGADSIATPAQRVQVALADTAHVLQRVRRRMDGTDPEAARRVSDIVRSGRADELLALFAQGDPALPRLEEAAWAGDFDGVVPGMRSLMQLRRPALTHVRTVGSHSLRTAILAATLGSGPGDPPTLVASHDLAESQGMSLPLLVAALTHDAGKLTPGPGHAERGAPAARQTALGLGLAESEADDAAELVRLHLALAEIATSADLDDEDTLLRAAERIARRELVAPLHLLTAADSLATGPGAWGPWHAALVDTLVSRLDAALDPERGASGLAQAAEHARAAALADLPTDASSRAREFVAHASLRYLAGRTPGRIVGDAALVERLDVGQSADAELSVSLGPLSGTREVSVVALDRPELMARLAGALALAGLDILSADAFAAGDGLALDVFVVRSATLAPISHDTWARLERYVRAALADRLELETRLEQRRHHYPTGRGPACTVTTDSSSGVDTTVLVTAPDRVGLLYDIARAVSSVGLDIRWAKAVTADGIARDAFHVVGPDGQAPTDPGLLGHLSMRIRERV